MKIVVISLLLAVAYSSPLAEWEAWKAQFSKKYSSDLEELTRMNTFISNKAYIDSHNQNKDKFGFDLAMNEFGDLTNAEFVQMMNGYKSSLGTRSGSTFIPPQTVSSLKDLPASVDWRTKGYVTPIKNQGQCGSCWAFSTTGSLEGQHFRKTGNLVSLSEQQLVDCSGKYGNQGCNGGLMDNAFKYIKENGGDDTEASYPYVAHDESCHFNPQTVGANDTGYVDIPSKDESKLQVAVATVGPISCAMDASHISFQFYHSGVYWSLFCSQTKLDHGVLSVGYGSEGSKEYWIMKNSWGTSWGMKGYFNLRRGKNECGVATAASYPTV
jgi:cathepsin L